MKVFSITYEKIESRNAYSARELKLIRPKLRELNELPYKKERLLEEAVTRMTKISLQCIQPKLSAVLND